MVRAKLFYFNYFVLGVGCLKCKCDICVNETCETDGYCFTMAQRETGDRQKIKYR